MVGDIVIGGVYQHYKGKNYLVREVALHSETSEWMVVYECLYDNPQSKLWVRPLSMFLEKVSVEGRMIFRFSYIGDKKGKTRL
jgi:hypothetical protein